MIARLAGAVTIAFALLVVIVSCARKEEGACKIDTDCPTGSFCRDTQCAYVDDGGVVVIIDGGTLVCGHPGDVCAVDSDCCSPPCNSSGKCAGAGTGSSGHGSSVTSGTSGTSGSSGAGCGDVFALCSVDTDCCTPYSCSAGSTCQ